MGFTGEANANTSDQHQHQHQQQQQDWGMGLLFVFFPGEEPENSAGGGASISNKKKNHNTPPFGPFPYFRRTNSNHLLSTAQSTISICALLIFVTFLLFALSTFEPSSFSNNGKRPSHSVSRRQLITQISSPDSSNNVNKVVKLKKFKGFRSPSHALQGMGSLYRRGTKSMNDLVVAHVVESLNLHEFKLFLRLFFGSALNSRADLLFLFSSKSAPFDSVILEETDSFLKVVAEYMKLSSARNSTNSTRSLEVPQFLKRSKHDKRSGEPTWGGKTKSNSSGGNHTELTRMSYGSVVGFDVDELDPENSLAGFLDHVPMSMRRWACYPMLLGRVRRNFKHIMLVDVKELLVVGDPLGRVRSSSPETVHLSTVHQWATTRHGKRNSERTQSARPKPVNPSILSGGARGIRRISQAMLNEIVRATAPKRKKTSVTEFGVFNQLVGNEFLLKNVKLITSTESIPELGSLGGSNSKSISNFTVVRRGNSNFDVNTTVLKNILCSSSLQNSVYSNCL